MAGTFKFQPSFAAGVLGPGLFGRIDLAKYQVGLKTGRNVFIHTHGGFSNRGGTYFVAEVPTHAVRHRLIPFERDDSTTYALLFGAGTMRVIRQGAMLATAIATPYAEADLPGLNYVQSIDVMYLASRAYPPRKLLHLGPTSWSMAALAINPPLPAPGTPTITPAATGDGKTYRYRVSSVIGGVESLPSAAGAVANAQNLAEEGAQNTVTWTAPGGATPDEYRVYRERGGVWGYIGFTEGTTLTLLDDNIDPDTNKSIRQASSYFSGAGNYPGVVALAQQRLIWGASTNAPETLWASVIGDYENFTRSMVLTADDRFVIDISGEKLNRVNGIVGLQELMVFTGSGEYGVGSTNGTLSATDPRQQRYGAWGSSGVRPLLVGDSILYVDRSGRQVRDLRYTFETDGYSGNDLTIFVPHFFVGRKIVDWAYCHSPFGLVWVVLDNGTVLSLTYKREQEVWAWTEHDFGGAVESVCAVNEGVFDMLYLIVRRTIGGVTKRYVERMCTRQIADSVQDACFLDSAVRYTGAATDTITGLAHLDGMTVNALGDGDVFEGLTVSGGQLTLPRAVSSALVGLPFVAEAETLPLSVDLQGTGNSRGLPVKATDAFVQMEKTRGVQLWTTNASGGTEMVQTIGDLSASIPMKTGLERFHLSPDWNDQGTIRVVQRYPLPMTILGISPRWNIGRG